MKYRQGRSSFADGVSQEACRDLGHTGWGIAAAVDTAETSRIQGQDVYPQVSERLRHASASASAST
ncbi:hypothetical protein [Streptomyces sp. NBC_00233]|uniref:hypothetical protein n=1 Tax=Streptomyces sp. NBC_00233 TaxID=2975686 RepID=UPI002B1D8B25|nr:hypothetical protein [Streptomyces sp. NBC_00233]